MSIFVCTLLNILLQVVYRVTRCVRLRDYIIDLAGYIGASVSFAIYTEYKALRPGVVGWLCNTVNDACLFGVWSAASRLCIYAYIRILVNGSLLVY